MLSAGTPIALGLSLGNHLSSMATVDGYKMSHSCLFEDVPERHIRKPRQSAHEALEMIVVKDPAHDCIRVTASLIVCCKSSHARDVSRASARSRSASVIMLMIRGSTCSSAALGSVAARCRAVCAIVWTSSSTSRIQAATSEISRSENAMSRRHLCGNVTPDWRARSLTRVSHCRGIEL